MTLADSHIQRRVTVGIGAFGICPAVQQKPHSIAATVEGSQHQGRQFFFLHGNIGIRAERRQGLYTIGMAVKCGYHECAPAASSAITQAVWLCLAASMSAVWPYLF